MSCAEIQAELVGYHFAIIEGDDRRRVEAHLVECRACTGAFVAIKRDLETADSGPAPSDASRLRLRAAVVAEVGRRRWSWWERPLAFGVAGAATFAAMAAVAFLWTGAAAPPHGSPRGDAAVPGATAPPGQPR